MAFKDLSRDEQRANLLKRYRWLLSETRQMITDAQSWNENVAAKQGYEPIPTPAEWFREIEYYELVIEKLESGSDGPIPTFGGTIR